MKKTQTWIWQDKNWPNFVFNELKTSHIYQCFGQLEMAAKLLNPIDVKRLKAQNFELEAIATSALEGETLSHSSLKASIYTHLGLGNMADKKDVQTDALLTLLIDAKNTDEPLSPARLFAWHQGLFPSQKKLTYPIHKGVYRHNKKEELRIISGTWEKEVLHYLAPPASKVEFEMNRFLLWLNTENKLDPIIKSAIAHIWFLLIHPFEDGNRRLARDISDHVLSFGTNIPTELFTLAFEINEHKNEFYETLDSLSSSNNLDISKWISWYINILSLSLKHALKRVQDIKHKALFWDKIQGLSLNARQRLVISALLNDAHKSQKLKTSLYASLYKTSKPTASRDLKDLYIKKILQVKGRGRGVYYELMLPYL
ncbi:MAG: hypothetical protein COA44_09605 [Arcobacter sp.]|nr:MAG: hypothetical protein COA44_09605 [Arcobacter sp.]